MVRNIKIFFPITIFGSIRQNDGVDCLFLCSVSQGAQEIFRLLPHKFVEPSELPKLASSVVKVRFLNSCRLCSY